MRCTECGSYAFNLYKEGIDQGDLCDVHYWKKQACPPPPMECKTDAEKVAYAYGWFKALELNLARKLWVGLTTKEQKEIQRQSVYVEGAIRMTEAKLKEKNNAN
jgi:hypothetical protein